jgi:hypothetical protein
MIQQVPLLRRKALGTSLFNFAYDPYTLIVKFPKDLGERFISVREMFKHSAAIVHESSHWVQHHGTTIGALLSLIHFSQSVTGSDLLFALRKDKLETLLTDRFNESSAIISIDAGGDLVFPDDPDRDTYLPHQMWYDHQLVYKGLLASAELEEAGCPPGEVFGQVIADGLLFISDRFQLGPYPGNTTARAFYHFSKDEIVFADFKGERLTTRGIMEGAASSNELRALAAYPEISGQYSEEQKIQDVNVALNELMSTDYGISLRSLLHLTESSEDSVFDLLPTLNLISDLALNPPVPPIVIPDVERYSWGEVYPPIRFFLLASQVQHVGWLKHFSDHQTLNEYGAKLLDAAGLRQISSYKYRLGHFQPKTDYDRAAREGQWSSAPQSVHYYDYLLWVHSKFWAARQHDLPLFVNLCECTIGDFSIKYIDHLIGEMGRLWFQPPLFWTSDDDIGHGQPASELGSGLLLSAATDYILFDILAGTGNIDMAAYPPDSRSKLRGRLAEVMAATYKWPAFEEFVLRQ